MARLYSSSTPGNPAQAKPWRQPRSYTKETTGERKMEVPPQKRCSYALGCTPLLTVRSAYVAVEAGRRGGGGATR
jgi:hypothetical protein